MLLRCKNLLAARTLHQALQNQNAMLEEKVRQRTKDLEDTLAELRASQQQRVQQERLRALGEMSSGVAQDFNNQLTVLIGYSDLLLLNNAQMVGNRPMAVPLPANAPHRRAGIGEDRRAARRSFPAGARRRTCSCPSTCPSSCAKRPN